ncbi:hypothetical protein RP20_CCG007492 [Aedes albopictus]|nr:hypothetical protein RP20_CCG007492 [Aedes albopictus]
MESCWLITSQNKILRGHAQPESEKTLDDTHSLFHPSSSSSPSSWILIQSGSDPYNVLFDDLPVFFLSSSSEKTQTSSSSIHQHNFGDFGACPSELEIMNGLMPANSSAKSSSTQDQGRCLCPAFVRSFIRLIADRAGSRFCPVHAP